MKKYFFLPFFVLGFLADVNAQQVIELINPSFEGIPSASKVPDGWYDCGREMYTQESPPDTHGEKEDGTLSNSFEVNRKAAHGKTFLGLIVRDNNTWESVSQHLSSSLRAGKTYTFSLYVARSENYLSVAVRRRNEGEFQAGSPINHNNPAILRIWGADTYCGKKREFLYKSELIENTKWEKLNMRFTPQKDCNYLILEVITEIPGFDIYNGNLLIDNCSAIEELLPETETPD